MKKFLFPLLACGMCVNTFSQNEIAPCCNVIAVDAVKNIVTARDKATGQLYQFKADAMDMRSIQKGDAINLAGNKISAINGSARTYVTFKPDYIQPCCSVVSVQVDGIEPCCSAVMIQNKSTNKSFTVNVPKQIAATLKTGHVVSIDAASNLAIMQSSYGSNGEMSSYGYAMTSLDDNKNDQEPCCSIVSMNSVTNTALVRDQITGRLYQFKADNMDIRSLQKGDAVTIAGNKISAINRSTRAYTTFKPDYIEPCCNVVSVQVDGIQPCCNAVTIQNKSTNKSFTVSVPKQIAATLKTGQAVSIDADNNLAVVQSSYGSNGGMNVYGYPATSGDGTTGNENATDKWVITPVSDMKGVLGKLNTNFPADVDWSVDIRTSENKFITNRSSYSKHGPSYDIAPGPYNFQLNTILVENVPIEKGKETRLKAGILSIVSEGTWELRSQSKEKFHTSGNKPKKFALPVGNYQLVLGGQFFPVVIKDRGTVEY